MPWVREIFMADVPNEDLLKFQDKLKLFYMKTLDFMESNNLPITKENILKNADRIRHWDIGSKNSNPENTTDSTVETLTIEPVVEHQPKEKKPCACMRISAIEADIFKFKRFVYFSFVLLLLIFLCNRNAT
ncbi:MAG: hypothetical protein RL463_881 [Bacteroidota bacterium]